MPGTGKYTGCDLSNLTPLFMPWQEMDGMLQPIFSPSAMQLSLELSSAAYDLDTDPWREAGWYDFSYQVDNTLLTGPALNGKGRMGVIGDYFRSLAHARIQRNNPISQLRGALRQREGSDTCKALIMIHQASGGRFVVAVGFMGTGKRIYDWFSNFRLDAEEGAHQGFLQLTREFEENLEKIQFPDTADALGLEKLSLKDILDRCRRPGSPFRIWLSGHSQGGAVMQMFAFREIRRGLLRQNLIGYGFASPSVLYVNPKCDPAGIPLFHIINEDDITPRLGARQHVGKCMIYHPDEKMRKHCYQDAWKDPFFREMLVSFRGIRESRGAMQWALGFFHALEALPDQESVMALSGIMGRMLPERLIGLLGGKMDQLLRFSIRHMEKAYQDAYEEEVPAFLVDLHRQQISRMLDQQGTRKFIKTLIMIFSLPHKLRGAVRENGTASYQYIVLREYRKLIRRIWCWPAPYLPAAKTGKTRNAPHACGRSYSAVRSKHLSSGQKNAMRFLTKEEVHHELK